MQANPSSHNQVRPLPWLLLVLAIVFATAAPAFAAGPAPDNKTAAYEVKFMQNMIDHHAMAVMMGEMCLAKATHQELREMCQEVVTTQTQESETMKTWLATWYGKNYEAKMSGKDERQMRELESLSGAEFEKAFMPMLVDHHRIALQRAAVCLQRAYHSELINMCGDIVTAQAAEIKQLRQWMCEWYQLCTNPRKAGDDDGADQEEQGGEDDNNG